MENRIPNPARRLPPLKALVAFEAAARHGNFSRGAEELRVTTSAVSHQIRQLEEFLGVHLFKRLKGSAVLTNAGKAYSEAIARSFQIIIESTNMVSPHTQSNQVVIATAPSLAEKWLQPHLPMFLSTHPDIKIRLTTVSDRYDIEEKFFDIALVHGEPPRTTKHTEQILSEWIRPLCSPEYSASNSISSLQDLSKATLIHSVVPFTWNDYFRELGHPNICMGKELWIDRSARAIDAAVKGVGVVLESEILAADEISSGQLVAPLGREFWIKRSSYYLVRAKTFRRDAHRNVVGKWLKELCHACSQLIE